MPPPADLARSLLEALIDRRQRIVFAESCTGGNVACELTKIAGVSEVLCGSAVTYREDTKQRWLGVDGETIENLSAVSAPVAHQMAQGALQKTAEADLAVSVTGHLGPHAPDGFDGLVFIGVARKMKGKVTVTVHQHTLQTNTRAKRQVEATACVLQVAINAI